MYPRTQGVGVSLPRSAPRKPPVAWLALPCWAGWGRGVLALGRGDAMPRQSSVDAPKPGGTGRPLRDCVYLPVVFRLWRLVSAHMCAVAIDATPCAVCSLDHHARPHLTAQQAPYDTSNIPPASWLGRHGARPGGSSPLFRRLGRRPGRSGFSSDAADRGPMIELPSSHRSRRTPCLLAGGR
jgi:hypothetical protein